MSRHVQLSKTSPTPQKAGHPALIDPFGRHISYLRLSVTDRCDLRCVYCMSEDMTFLPKKDVLSYEELDRIASAFIDLGVRKLRLSGGEPLVRKDIMTLVNSLSRHLESGALDEITLTTNASLLHRYAIALYSAGVRRVNVSLDTLNANTYEQLTRGGNLAKTLAGIEAAAKAGLKIKINTVVLSGVNDQEVDALIAWCGAQEFDLTFIEVMPMGDIGNETRLVQFYPLRILEEDLAKRWTLTRSDKRTGGPARYVTCQESGGTIGFISALTQNFCSGCNRVRVTCTGQLYLCLGQEDALDLRSLLRRGSANEVLKDAIYQSMTRKPRGHDFLIDSKQGVSSTPRYMSTTGG